MPQVDSSPEYSAKIYYGGLKNINYPYMLNKELSGKLSNVHKKAKNQVEKIKENNNISEIETFTGRTIKFILNEISNLTKNEMINDKNITENYLSEIIKSTFENYYFNSFNISNNLKSYELFRKNVADSFLESIKINIEIGNDDLISLYNDIFEDINNIKNILNSKNEEIIDDVGNAFNFSNFFNKCMTIKTKHLKGILSEISRIYKKIDYSNKKKSF